MRTTPPRPVPRVKVTAPSLRALHRQRLIETLGGLSERRVAFVVAQAGSGKTTLLSQFAATSRLPVAWYRAEPDDGRADAMVHGLASALSAVVRVAAEQGSVDDLVAAVDRVPGEGAVLIVDDLHTVAGTEGEAVIGRLLHHAPPTLALVLASRALPGFDLSRLRVSGDPIEIGPDDLRFRSWEVERLFADFYGERLPPQDLAELARRTEGWAAGLQLFHLATRGKPLRERRRILSQLSSQSGMMREYLASNVLGDLPDDLRRFLVATCVLGRLTGPLCDELLDAAGSEKLLDNLVSRQIFTVRIEGGRVFRYHEVLRSHLEGVLVAEVGEAEAKRRHQRAGELLLRSGAVSEALLAYCRGGDWHAAAHILGRNGGPAPPGQGAWIDELPPAILDQDPWFLVAKARQLVELGNWPAALQAYRVAERRFPAGVGQETCGRERRALALWLQPAPSPRADWLGLLRAATQGDPLEVAAEARKLPGPEGRFTEAVALLLSGRVAAGRRALENTTELPDVGPVVGAVARLLAAGATLIETGTPDRGWESALEEVEAAGIGWVTRLLRDTLKLAGGVPPFTARQMIDLHESEGDTWGAALLALVEAFCRLCRGAPAAPFFEESASRFRRLAAGALERWARAGLVLARAREGQGGTHQALSAQAMARANGLPGASVLTFMALAMLDPARDGYFAGLARSAAEDCGIRWPCDLLAAFGDPSRASDRRRAGTARSNPGPELRCFGQFQLRIDGEALDLTGVKPRVRAALFLLAIHTGQPLHRERLVDAFWPEVEPQAGIRNLQVVLSTLRQLVAAVRPAGAVQITREGDAYRLALPPGATADILLFQAAVTALRHARKNGDGDGVIAAAEDGLGLFTGDLLPEAGPADWIVAERDRYRREAADAAQYLAEMRLGRDEYDAAVEACERGLVLDRYRDSLWRTMAGAYDGLGDSASAARVRSAYGDVLAELGIST